jgi:beta-galactosidase
MHFHRLAFCLLILTGAFGNSRADDAPPFSRTTFDAGWEFTRLETSPPRTDSSAPANHDLTQELSTLSDKTWEKVTLPHTAFIEPKDITNSWQGICYYRKTFTVPAEAKGKRVVLEFGAAMQIADIWVNNQYVLRHAGGYLGFVVDLTNVANYGGDNTICVKLDNRPDPLIPPGKELDKLDFCYYSGLYRDVWLHVTDKLHITDPLEVEKVAGGGVFVTYEGVSSQSATVKIKTDVKLESSGTVSPGCEVHQEITDLTGAPVAQAAPAPFELQSGEEKEIEQAVTVSSPKLWSPDHPNLYLLKTEIFRGGALVDQATTRIGIRTFSVTRQEGFKINDQPVRLMGTDRHQEYPWIGNAVSANAHYRDIWLIKNTGFNIVRLCHYPQDPSVYEACDELGVLAIDCIPGWQYYSGNPTFQENVFHDIRQMIRRDRNHPSIALWETNLNESRVTADFCKKSVAAAQEEYPGILTSGDEAGANTWDVPYPKISGDVYNIGVEAGAPYFAREYGDWNFGGNNSTSRRTRADGNEALLLQAWNFAYTHNYIASLAPAMIGDATWVMFDYNRGYNRQIETSGMAEITRLPKPVYYFYQSQRDPAAASPGAEIEAGPMVVIASDWTQQTAAAGKVVVFSNCEEVELLVNGKSMARQPPDHGPDSAYDAKTIWDGGNGLHVSHPAFTFAQVAGEAGELKAVGYRQNQAVAQQSVFTPGDPAKLALEPALQHRPLAADGADVIFVHARVMDGQGHLCSEAKNSLTFNVTGPARLISPADVTAEGGIGSILLQATDQPGTITVSATGNGLTQGSVDITSVVPSVR